MGGLVACGVIWRYLLPEHHSVQQTRHTLTSLVYYLFLPALVLLVMWQAPLGLQTAKISIIAMSGVIASVIVISFICSLCRISPGTRGAAILAASFPNATYLGLPVLEATLGPEGRPIAIQYDLFACLPLLFSLGIWIAIKHGQVKENRGFSLWKVPAIWAALVAVTLNLSHIVPPVIFRDWLQLLANGVVPLMLISLGLSLNLKREYLGEIRSVAPVILVKLLIMPAVVFGIALLLGVPEKVFYGVVLEAAMPSMVIGIVFCDRFGLNTHIYAAAVTITTLLSFISLQLWYTLAASL
jgi:predicted permease